VVDYSFFFFGSEKRLEEVDAFDLNPGLLD
jgi:hypothetical protein